MGRQIESSNVDVVAACVRLLEDLEQELHAATSAIARNKLARLEESLWRQEMLCAGLKRFISTFQRAELEASLSPLREAASRLGVQAKAYEKLVARSIRATATVQRLYSLYRNASQHPGRTAYQAISREA